MRRLLAGAVVAALLPLVACSSGPKPEPTARAYLSAWAAGDLAGAGRLTDAPAAATAALTQVRTALAVTGGRFRLGAAKTDKGRASASYAATLALRGIGDWAYDGTLALRKADGRWRVHWTPMDVHPRLAAGQRLGRTRQLLRRAPLVDRTGRPLVTPTEVVTVSILPSALRHRAGTLALLARTLRVDATRVGGLLDKAKPDQLVPVIPLRRSAYDRVRAAIHDVPGLRFPVTTKLLAPTPTYARAVLGRTGEATADALKAAGPPYQVGDELGLSGLQAAYQRQLAGTPGGSIVVRDAAGTIAATLHEFPGMPGSPVRTTLDRQVQDAAEKALGSMTTPAALVAVRPSDGSVLAAANRPGDSVFDRALAGHYPPGSTFKIVTTAALLGRGLRLDDAVRCPPSVTVDGKTFRNFEGEAGGSLPFRRDFAISCNTAFVGLSARLGTTTLADTAKRFGVGAGWSLPIAAYDGSVPAPGSAVELAADAIGQGRVSVSPLGMAMAAGAVRSGSWRPPVLVTDPSQPASTAAPARIAAAPQLRELMRLVVTSGTAAGAFRAYGGKPVSGKTGTAEYGTGTSPRTHAWFVGFRGDLAYAVVVEGGGVGGRVAAPLAVKFLRALGP